jgi:hypothetical protein
MSEIWMVEPGRIGENLVEQALKDYSVHHTLGIALSMWTLETSRATEVGLHVDAHLDRNSQGCFDAREIC